MVLDTNSHDLTRAARRAYVHSLTATCVGHERHGYNGSEFFDVASFSTAGLMHRVRLDYSADGIEAHCDCMAGQNERICQHVAAALEASVALSEPEPVQPKPAPRVSAGILARLPLSDELRARMEAR